MPSILSNQRCSRRRTMPRRLCRRAPGRSGQPALGTMLRREHGDPLSFATRIAAIDVLDEAEIIKLWGYPGSTRSSCGENQRRCASPTITRNQKLPQAADPGVATRFIQNCRRFQPNLSSTPADRSFATSRDRCRVPAGLGLRTSAVAFPVYPRIPVVRKCSPARRAATG